MLINAFRPFTPLMTGQSPAMAVSMNLTRMRRRRIHWSAFSYNQCQESIFSPSRCKFVHTLRPVPTLTTGQWPAMAVSMTSTRMRRRRIHWSANSYSQCQENVFSPMRRRWINTLRPVTSLTTRQWAAMAVSMTPTCMRRLRIPIL